VRGLHEELHVVLSGPWRTHTHADQGSKKVTRLYWHDLWLREDFTKVSLFRVDETGLWQDFSDRRASSLGLHLQGSIGLGIRGLNE
jgi:hypothetical protein